MKHYLNDNIKNAFQKQGALDTKKLKNLLSIYFYNNKKVNDNTLAWRIHDLKEKDIIRQVGRGVYALSNNLDKKKYHREITNTLISIFCIVRENFPYVNLCMEDTRWYNEFMVHQVFKNATIVEVEKEAVDAVFRKLAEKQQNVFVKPDLHIFETYISETENPVIVKSLISESPIIEQNDIKVPSLEKMLVDLIGDDELYSAQNSEAPDIYKATMEKYALNMNKLKRYARRRNKWQQIRTLIDNQFDHD